MSVRSLISNHIPEGTQDGASMQVCISPPSPTCPSLLIPGSSWKGLLPKCSFRNTSLNSGSKSTTPDSSYLWRYRSLSSHIRKGLSCCQVSSTHYFCQCLLSCHTVSESEMWVQLMGIFSQQTAFLNLLPFSLEAAIPFVCITCLPLCCSLYCKL